MISARTSARLLGSVALGAIALAAFQIYALRCSVARLAAAQAAHDARKGERETFFYRVLPVLAAVAGVAAAAGWLR